MKLTFLLLILFVTACGKVSQKSSVKKQDPGSYYKTKNLTIKVYYEPGAEPYTTDANPIISLQYWSVLEDNLKALFTGRKIEPSITVPKTLGEMKAIPLSGDNSWTIDDVLRLSQKYGKSSDASTFEIYFVNGEAAESSGIIAFHISDTRIIVVFKDVIRSTGSGMLEAVPKYVEQATLIHEMGHALGLVNNGVPMHEPHQDKGHGAHCSDPDCVMYYMNEGASGLKGFVGKMIQNRNTIMFDDKCLKDTRSF